MPTYKMPHWIEAILKLLTQFSGSRGGIDHVIVEYVIAAFFYATLFAIARAKYRDDPKPRESWLTWGFAFGLGRELFMLLMAVILALGFVKQVQLHEIFPPFEHMLLGLALVIIPASFLRYLLDDEALSRRYLKLGIIAVIFTYAITAAPWAHTLAANPKLVFGKTWYDLLFHANASLWLIIAAYLLATRTQGKVRNYVVLALMLYLMYEFLKIPDILLNERYEYIFAPIRVMLYLAAIPVLGYVYVHEQSVERKKQLNNLESLVQERTLELEVALKNLSASNESLQQADKIKSEFLATMSHELRTPLNSILGFTGLVRQGTAGPVNEEQRRQLGMAYGSAKHLLSLINDILDLSRIEAGRMELFVEPINIRQIMQEAMHSMEPMQAQKKLRFNLEVSDAISVVHGDYKKIMQVLLNLLNNAVKFTDFGEITLRCQPDAASLVFSVSDTGCGMHKESIPLLFNAFRQITSEDNREYGGTGLGLYLCQKLVNLMGGKIWVESEYGVGSTFSFNLPTLATTPSSPHE